MLNIDGCGTRQTSVPPGTYTHTYTVTGTSPLYGDGQGICSCQQQRRRGRHSRHGPGCRLLSQVAGRDGSVPQGARNGPYTRCGCWSRAPKLPSAPGSPAECSYRLRTRRSAASTCWSSSCERCPTRSPSRCGSAAAVCSASTRVTDPWTSTSGRNVAGRAEVDVGATSHVERGSASDWTTTANRAPACS